MTLHDIEYDGDVSVDKSLSRDSRMSLRMFVSMVLRILCLYLCIKNQKHQNIHGKKRHFWHFDKGPISDFGNQYGTSLPTPPNQILI